MGNWQLRGEESEVLILRYMVSRIILYVRTAEGRIQVQEGRKPFVRRDEQPLPLHSLSHHQAFHNPQVRGEDRMRIYRIYSPADKVRSPPAPPRGGVWGVGVEDVMRHEPAGALRADPPLSGKEHGRLRLLRSLSSQS